MKGAPTAMKKKPLNLPAPKPKRPVLRFTPTAWAKLLFLRDVGPTEIGGFGLAAAGDLLLVEDIALVEQVCTAVHVAFEDRSVADLFDEQVDAGRQPEEFGRIWVHTHPGNSAEPSRTDEVTLERVFGTSDWAVMFILARGGQSYARLRYNVGPGADVQLPIEVSYCRPFEASNQALWQCEYDRCVRPELPPPPQLTERTPLPFVERNAVDDWYGAWADYVDPFDSTDPIDPIPETNYGYRDDF
jgi:proteasome lid subunit RPN8/RPN11